MEKVNKEKQLKKISSSVFSTVFFNNLAIMLLIDPQNNQQIIDVNETAIKFYGYSREEFLSLNMGQINTISEEERHNKMKEARKKPHNYFHFVHKTSSGSTKDVEIQASPIVYEKKKVMFLIVHDITNQKAIESKLVKSEERLGFALAGSDLGLWDWWVQTGEAHYNKKWAEIIGYTLEELYPVSVDTWKANTHPDDMKESDRMLQKCFNKDTESYECEIRMKHKDGSWVWILDRGKVFEWDKDGKPIRMSGTHINITEIKQAEFKIAESEKRYKSFFESSPLSLWEQDETDVIIYLDEQIKSYKMNLESLLYTYPEIVNKCVDLVKIIDVNPATLKLYKAHSKEDLLWSLSRVFTEESYRTFKSELIYIYNRESIPTRVSTNKLLDGKIIDVSVETALLSDNRYIKTVTDITEQKRITKKLATSEERLGLALTGSGLGLWDEWIPTGELYVNDRWAEIIGYTLEEISPVSMKFWRENTHPDDLKEVDIIGLKSPRKEVDIINHDIRMKHKNGSWVWVRTRGKVVEWSDDEKPLRSAGTHLNITESKLRELELKKLLSQTKADFETKEILLREINHRVKNNLSSFIGMLYAEKKQSGSDPDTVQMEHVDNLINRVKGISIAHEMLSRSHWAPISINKLAEKIIHSLNHLIPKDRIIHVKINPSDIFLDADQSHSTAILLNELFSNSIEHASHPGEKIEVEIEIKEQNETIYFLYRDSGPGYPEEILKSEFKNVGMYLIKNIAEQSLRGVFQISNKSGAKIEIEFPGGSKLEEL